MWGDIIDYGSLPAWAAFIAAAWAGYTTFKNLDNAKQQLAIAQQTRAAELDQQRRAQASQVAVWSAKDGFGESVVVAGNNSSGLPVFDVYIYLRLPQQEVRLHWQPTFAPTEKPVPLKDASTAYRNAVGAVPGLDVVMHDEGEFQLALSFRDTSGVTWHRGYGGRLTEA